MDIQLRLIQKESVMDRNHYFALQKSVVLNPNIELDNKNYVRTFRGKICFIIKNMLCDRNDTRLFILW